MRRNHNFKKVKDELELRGNPVFIAGIDSRDNSGHAWIADGYEIKATHELIRLMTFDYREISGSDQSEMIEATRIESPWTHEIRLHFNWGYDKSYDNYYFVNHYDVDGHHYDKHLEDLVILNM